jgi:hypothetical protein
MRSDDINLGGGTAQVSLLFMPSKYFCKFTSVLRQAQPANAHVLVQSCHIQGDTWMHSCYQGEEIHTMLTT